MNQSAIACLIADRVQETAGLPPFFIKSTTSRTSSDFQVSLSSDARGEGENYMLNRKTDANNIAVEAPEMWGKQPFIGRSVLCLALCV